MKKISLGLALSVLIAAACSQNYGAGYGKAFKPSHFSRDGDKGFSADNEPNILPETFYAAGRLFEEQQQWGKAAIQYQKAAAVKHDFAPAFDRLGTCLGKLGQHADAIKAFEKAVQLQPNYASYRNNLGFAYAAVADWVRAESALQKAVELQPDFARARINLGMVQCRLGNWQQGFDQFHAVLPEADSYYNLGLMLRGQQRYQDASAAFNHVLALNPQFVPAREQLDQIKPRMALADAGSARLQIPFSTFAPPAESVISGPDSALVFSTDTLPGVAFADSGSTTAFNDTTAQQNEQASNVATMPSNPVPATANTNVTTTLGSENGSTPVTATADGTVSNGYGQPTALSSGAGTGSVAYVPAVSVNYVPPADATLAHATQVQTRPDPAVSSFEWLTSTPTMTATHDETTTSTNMANTYTVLGSEVIEADDECPTIGYFETDQFSTWDDFDFAQDGNCEDTDEADAEFVDDRDGSEFGISSGLDDFEAN